MTHCTNINVPLMVNLGIRFSACLSSIFVFAVLRFTIFSAVSKQSFRLYFPSIKSVQAAAFDTDNDMVDMICVFVPEQLSTDQLSVGQVSTPTALLWVAFVKLLDSSRWWVVGIKY